MVRSRLIKYIVAMMVMILPLYATAQIKVLEKSSKKAPEWLVSTGNNYFVSSNVAPTLESAKQMCLDDIKRQIISAIAENVKMETSQQTNQVTSQQTITEFTEEFTAKFETRSAVVPFINGISLSKAKDYYYEKTQDKRSKAISYSYSVLYPFSRIELETLIKKFNAQDSEMEAILDKHIAKLDDITSTDDIDKGIVEITPLLDYFFDDVRIQKTKQTLEAYKKLYTLISLEMVSSKPGSMIYTLMLNGRVISTQVKPTLRYNCAMEVMQSNANDGMSKVTYDNGGCIDGEDNWIEVSYRLPHYSLKKRFYPIMTTSPLNITPTGEMIVKLNEVDSLNNINGMDIEFQLNNSSKASVKVTAMTLKLKELNSTINESGLDVTLSNGVCSVKIHSDANFKLTPLNSTQALKHLQFTNGTINVTNVETGDVEVVPVVVKYKIEQ